MEDKIQTILLAAIDELSCIQYLNTRKKIIRTAVSIENRLARQHTDPDLFCISARIDPTTFDLLVSTLEDQPIFHNELHNS